MFKGFDLLGFMGYCNRFLKGFGLLGFRGIVFINWGSRMLKVSGHGFGLWEEIPSRSGSLDARDCDSSVCCVDLLLFPKPLNPRAVPKKGNSKA